MTAMGIPQSPYHGNVRAGGAYCRDVRSHPDDGMARDFSLPDCLVQAAIGQKCRPKNRAARNACEISGTVDFREPDDDPACNAFARVVDKMGIPVYRAI